MDAGTWNQMMQKIKVDEIIYKAAVRGDVSILDGRSRSTSVTIKDILESEENVLHVAAKHGQTDFISHVCAIDELRRHLIHQRNCYPEEDTPLHVAARHGHADAATCLVANAGDNPDYLLVTKNKDEDTPLHVALRYRHFNLAHQLSRLGPQALSQMNHERKTPLHLLIDCFPFHKGQKMGDGGIMELEDILKHFLLSFKMAAKLPDTYSCTPLLKAADMRLYRVLKTILAYCPESAVFYGKDRRTLLHHINFLQYEELQELLRIPEIYALKNVRDAYGDTPAHLAAKNRDFMLLKVLNESLANFSIKNGNSMTVDELIEPHLSSLRKLEEATFRSKGEWMKTYLYNAAATNKGDVTVFDKRGNTKDKKKGGQITYDDNYFLCRMPNGSTILHLAVRNGHLEFVKKTLEQFPTLIFSTDFRGNSAIHIIAQVKNAEAEEMMRSCVECYKKIHNEKNEYMRDSLYSSSLWKVKNVEGCTALHEALRANNHNIVSVLLTIEPSLGLEARLDTYTGPTLEDTNWSR